MSMSIWCTGRTSRRPSRRPCAPSTMVRQGKTRYIGVSNFRLDAAGSAACSCGESTSCSTAGTCSTGACSGDLPVGASAARRGDGVWLARLRLLSGTFHADMTVRRERLARQALAAGEPEPVPHHVRPRSFPAQPGGGGGVEEPSPRAIGKTLPQLALSWTTVTRAIATPLVGFRRPEEVEENLGALGWKLSPRQTWPSIDAIFARHDAITEPEGWLEDDQPATSAC